MFNISVHEFEGTMNCITSTFGLGTFVLCSEALFKVGTVVQ